MSTYFVTGATGVVGSVVTEALLKDPSVRVRLLIRARDDRELEARRADLLRFWGDERFEVDGRVVAIRGDATLPGLGIASGAYLELAREVTHIVHCAAAVRMNLPLEEARRSAVTATRNVIDLARACREGLRKVEIVSTVGVGGRRPEALGERWLSEPREFHNTYEQAKAEAEALVEQEIANGLPAAVHRPSMVIGDSRTGKILRFQIFYHLAEFLTGRRTLGLFPAPGPTRLDLVPADYVGRAIAWSSTQRATAGRVLHLCAGPEHSLPIAMVRERVRARFAKAGIRLPPGLTVPRSWFRAAVPALAALATEKQRRALGTLPIFLDYLAENQVFANAATVELLAAAGIVLPDLRETLDRALDYYLERRSAPG
jgi:thioester reductase-like protein